MAIIDKVSIALQPSVYSTFRALNNTVALTLSEYVDNSVQSFLNNKERLRSIDPNYKFSVRIHIDQQNDSISIKDNAAGIDQSNYLRAFEPANIPLDATGLNEFGMGMKTASVWLADVWSVRTKALGEEVERYTKFDLQKVIKENREELIVDEVEKPTNEHYTEIVLEKLSKNSPSSNQMDKIRRHLSSIYRKFIRSGEVEIIINGEVLSSPNYEILNAPYYKTPKGEDILWKKDIVFELAQYKVKGFIAILKNIQNNANGLVLLRRGRVIVGGSEERYFPQMLFGQPGNFRYKRLFGELELEGFDVTFNKNGFRDEDDLLAFLEELKQEQLKDPEFNLLGQADNFRQKSKEENAEIAKKIILNQKKETTSKQLTRHIQEVENKIQNSIYQQKTEELIINAEKLDSHSETFEYNGETYRFRVDLVDQDEADALYTVMLENEEGELFDESCIVCKVNLSHPFFNRFEQIKKANDYEPIVAIFKSLALAEFFATKKHMLYPAELRLLFNQYIVQ